MTSLLNRREMRIGRSRAVKFFGEKREMVWKNVPAINMRQTELIFRFIGFKTNIARIKVIPFNCIAHPFCASSFA